MRTRRLALLAIACFQHLTAVVGAPSINFPVNLQVPPVARASQQFSFTFAESTFIVSEEPIAYSLLDEPEWLRFDSDARTFFGNVTTNDAGPTTFNLVASDSSGSTSSEVTFIVTDQAGPQLGKSILSQLGHAGRASAPASLLLYPLEAFSIIFAPDTFSVTTKDTTFYATSADNSPLPSWLQFDPTSLRFSGTGPPLVSPTAKPQEYGVRLIASDIVGFAEAVASFRIVVGYKILAFSEASQTVELSQGQTFETQPLREDLTLDGESVDNTELASVTSNAPSWAELDEEKILLRGTPPQGATSQSVLIEVADIYGDTTYTIINLVVSSSQRKLFNSSLGAVNVTSGQDFRHTIESSTISSSSVLVTADLTNASSWLTYDATSRTFSGSVPDDILPGAILITLNATLGPTTELERLTVNVLKSSVSKPPSYTSQGLPSSTNQPDLDVNHDSNDAPENNNWTLAIVLGVLLPLLFLLCLGALVLCCFWRRRRHRRPSRQGSEIDISRPVIRPEPEHTEVSDLQGDSQPEKTPTSTSPPRIELPWAPDSLRKSRERLSKITTNRESTLVGSGWGDFVLRDAPAPARSSRRQMQTDQDTSGGSGDWTPFVRSGSNNLNYSRKRIPLQPIQSKAQKPSASSRASNTLGSLTNISVGLPVRLSGAGHGAGGTGPPGFHDVRRSWRNTVDSFASDEGRTTPFDLEAFPTPPGVQNPTQAEQEEEAAKPSVRLVPSSSSHSGSLADQRQRWVRERARERYERGSRFSHAWSSRVHSRARGLDSSIRSLSGAKSGSLGTEDLLSRRNTQRSWSRSSSVGAPVRPETSTRRKSPDSHLVRHPSNLRRALSTVSSGRFDSAESKSNSSWVDDLIEEEDEDGHRRWAAVDKSPQENTPVASPALREGEESGQGSWGKNSRTGGLGALRANIKGVGQALPSVERRWRLGDEQARRPISIDEGELQRSQGSQRGNLAFI
jgi:axial budding pattern protein 2